MEKLRAEVVVVGGGVHGSSAALHLARAGRNTILLEQFPLPHGRGSSHGQTRIIRIANSGVPALTPIMVDSYAEWRQLEEEGGVSLLRPAPMLVMGIQDEEPTMNLIAKSMEREGHPPLWQDHTELSRKYKLNLSPGGRGFIDPKAGILMADKCLVTLQRLFVEAGGRVVDEWAVEDVEVERDGEVVVRGPRGEVRAGKAVLCPGPWAGPLLAKMGVHIPLRVERISVYYWRMKEKDTPTVSFIDYDSLGHFFGLSEAEYPGLMKVCYHGGPEVKPEDRDLGGASQELRETTIKYVRSRFMNLEPEPAIEESCLYTVTPDKEFVVDRHPKHPNVVFACGFSGSGFKVAPVVGRNLCRLVLGQPPLHDLRPFSASRFNPRSKM